LAGQAGLRKEINAAKAQSGVQDHQTLKRGNRIANLSLTGRAFIA
jgi:hypothetical protein